MYSYQTNWTVLLRYRGLLWEGLLTALEVALLGLAIGCLLGVIGAFAQVSRNRLARWVSVGYVEFIRNIPMLLILFFVYFGLPLLGVRFLDEKWSATVTLGVYAGAYLTEIFRAGILAVPKGQIEAGRSIGLVGWQVGVYVMFPQILRVVLPSLSNTFVSLFKDTSLAAAISVHELTYAAMRINTDTWRVVESWVAVGAIYLISSYLLTLGLRVLERSLARWA